MSLTNINRQNKIDAGVLECWNRGVMFFPFLQNSNSPTPHLTESRLKRVFIFSFFLIIFLEGCLFAGAWTLPKKQLWLKSSIYYQNTSSRFCNGQDALAASYNSVGCHNAGDSAPFDPFVEGESRALGAIIEAYYGATGWLDFGVELPFYSLQFTNLANPDRPTSNNFGDIRFIGKLRFIEKPFIATLKASAKAPTGEFTVDAEAVNLSEGQWDYEFFGEFAKSFWPLRLYVNLDVGYRIRTDNKNIEYTFGNEFLLLAEAGYNLSDKLMVKGTFDWLRGERPTIKITGNQLPWRRELLSITPSFIYSPQRNLGLEAGIRFPIAGEDFPNGPVFTGGVTYQFSLL